MKSFDEFMASFGPEEVAAIMSDANEKAAEIRKITPDSDKTNLGNQIGVVSFTIALEIVGLYHKWLEQQL